MNARKSRLIRKAGRVSNVHVRGLKRAYTRSNRQTKAFMTNIFKHAINEH